MCFYHQNQESVTLKKLYNQSHVSWSYGYNNFCVFFTRVANKIYNSYEYLASDIHNTFSQLNFRVQQKIISYDTKKIGMECQKTGINW